MDHMGRVALVCASSRGLGKACADALLRDNANVVICSHDKVNLGLAKEELEKKHGRDVTAIVCDLGKKGDTGRLVEMAVREHWTIHILVNNTPGPKPGGFFDFGDGEWEEAHNNVLMPIVRLHRLVLPMMKKQGFGRVINLTSIAVKEPIENLVLSDVYRAGIVSMAKVLSKEYAKHNVFINNIAQAAFRTERYVQLMKMRVTPEKSIKDVEDEIVKGIPVGRLQDPMELGNLVSFLSSEKCCITGVTIPIDGGSSKGVF